MIWKKKKCNFCGYQIKDDWNFCPKCSKPLREFDLFEKMISDIETEFERIDKEFKKPKLNVRGGEIHITVQSGTGIQPKIEVKTTGDYKNIEPEIKKKLGISETLQSTFRKAKKTEEPETKTIKKDGKTIIKINLPGIKSEDQIEIKQFEQSIEIKAFEKNKTYFKLIPIPSNAFIDRKFKDGVLELQIN